MYAKSTISVTFGTRLENRQGEMVQRRQNVRPTATSNGRIRNKHREGNGRRCAAPERNETGCPNGVKA